MVHNKDGGSNKKASPIRSSSRIRSARFQPTSREIPAVIKPTPQRNLNQTWSTIYKLELQTPTQVQNTLGTNHSRPCPAHLLQGLKNFEYRDETRHSMTSSLRIQRNAKSLLDKVEDMDIDNQSDQEGTSFGEESIRGTSSRSNSSAPINGKSVKTRLSVKDSKNSVDEQKELKKNSDSELSPSGFKVKRKTHENFTKKKPIYIILHASLLRISHLEGRALKPVRIQAGRILIEMELQSNNRELPTETLTLRIPCKELHGVKVSLSEPPFLFVAIINQDYSKTLIENSKNGMLSKLKGTEKLQIILHLMYDVIPDDISQDFNHFQSELDASVKWDELSPTDAECILSGHDSGEDDTISTKDQDKKDVCLSKEVKKDPKGNRKRQINCETESTSNNASEQSTVKSERSDAAFSIKEKKTDTSMKNSIEDSTSSSLSVVNRRRKRTYDETIPKCPDPNKSTEQEERTTASDEKTVPESENRVTSPKSHHPEVVSTDGPKALKVNGFTRSPLNERSFEEERVEARRVFELETTIAENERLLTQQRRTVELRDLQLQQEYNTVRELRATLRDEQRLKRDLEARYEAINGELLVRNEREAIANSRVDDLERELSELNLSLNNSRTENERLVQEIRQVRDRLTENEDALRTERERATTLQNQIESNRATLENLRGEIGEKDLELAQERELRTTASERNNELERQLIATRQEYEERINRDNEEHTRTRREHEECNHLLSTTREQLQNANRALHRAQETVDEYSRMQPRDWTISRDEITITERVLGQGAWGWVKEGKFRGTMVAVKQMHELIVSPHNRRLFEREMQIAARCRHPNLLQFIGATNDNGLALLLTELLDTDLRAVLGQRSLCQDEVVTIATDVSRALNYLHLNKPFPIIHRDISSTNVLLWKRENRYHAKLSDYGAANFMRQCMTVNPGACIYAAPEAMTSRQSTKVDVYSFGLLLCEMCIRELPVPGHIHDQIRSITNGHLRELVQRSTHEMPDDRPTMSEVLTALLRLRTSSLGLGTVSINNRHVSV